MQAGLLSEIDKGNRDHIHLIFICGEKGGDLLENVGRQDVVGVEEVQVGAGRMGQSCVACACLPAVFLFEIDDVFWILVAIGLADLAAVVGRAVVHEDNLNLFRKTDALSEDTLDGLFYIRLHVIDRHDD